MQPTIYTKIAADAAAHLQIRRGILTALMLSLTANVLLSVWQITRTDDTRTIVLSPGATTEYIAMSDTVSPNLLERFAMTGLNLVTNMTPASAAWQTEAFLAQVAPESYGALSSALRRGATALQMNHAATAFFTQAATVDPQSGRVCIKGEKKTFIGTVVTESRLSTVCLTTVVRNGRIWIAGLEERAETAEAAGASRSSAAG